MYLRPGSIILSLGHSQARFQSCTASSYLMYVMCVHGGVVKCHIDDVCFVCTDSHGGVLK